MEAELVKRHHIPFQGIPAAGLHGVGLRRLPGNTIQLLRGYQAARRVINNFKPDVLLFTGGYVAVPVAFAGRSRPILLYVPDIEPGLALKTAARFADRIALTTETSRAYFSTAAKTEVTGYPVRPELARWERTAARRELGLSDDRPVLLVFGGSKGARSINLALVAALNQLLPLAQIVHITGENEFDGVQQARSALDPAAAANYHIMPYLHEMGAALAAADLAVSRSGASSLGEYPLFGLPAILVPYPYAWRYQRTNADYLAQRGAAVVLENDRLSSELASLVISLLRDPQRLESMRASLRGLARADAADRIAGLARELVAQAGRKGAG